MINSINKSALIKFIIIMIFLASNLWAQKNLLPIIDGKKIGWIDNKGKIVIEPQYNNNIEYYKFEIGNKLYSSIRFPENSWFSEDRAFVRVNKKFLIFFTIGRTFKYINSKNEVVIDSLQEWSGRFNESLAVYKLAEKYFRSNEKQKYSYMTLNGKRAIKRNFNLAQPFIDGVALVIENDNYEYIDKHGNTIIDGSNFEAARSFSDGLAAVKIKGKWGFINKSGVLVIENKFEFAENFNDNLCKVMDSQGMWGFINTSGEFINNNRYLKATNFQEGIAAILSKNENGFDFWKFIDRTGKVIINQEFLSVSQFSEGKAVVETLEGFRFIDTEGNFIIENSYIFAEAFRNGAARVIDSVGLHYIDAKGNILYTLIEY